MPTTKECRELLLRAEAAEAQCALAVAEVTRLQEAACICNGCGEPMGKVYCSDACTTAAQSEGSAPGEP